jgi:arylsulfatase A-like enzyme
LVGALLLIIWALSPGRRTEAAFASRPPLAYAPEARFARAAHHLRAAVSTRPSILIVLTDDETAEALPTMPNVRDLLTTHGVRFTQAYVSNPLCSPSRAAILAGTYSHTNDVYRNHPPDGGAPSFHDNGADDDTLPVWLHRAGYHTGLFGKYLNLYKGEYVPRGWDTFLAGAGYYGGNLYGTETLTFDQTTYLPRELANRTADFIRETPADQPFFAYFAPSTPHKRAVPEHRYAKTEVSVRVRANVNEADVSDKPKFIRQLPRLTAKERRKLKTFRNRQLRALITTDDDVGRLVDVLAETDRLHDTIIVFLSDNGQMWGAHRLPPGEKRLPYREASKMPLVMRYDAEISPHIENSLIGNVDLAPTLADLAGVPHPRTDGLSFAERLRDPAAPAPRKHLVLESWDPEPDGVNTIKVPGFCGIRTTRRLYARYQTGAEELYDTGHDPYELRNRVHRPAWKPELRRLRALRIKFCPPLPHDFAWKQ